MSCQRQRDTHCISFSINAKRLTSLLEKKLKGGENDAMTATPVGCKPVKSRQGSKVSVWIEDRISRRHSSSESVDPTPGASIAVYRTVPQG